MGEMAWVSSEKGAQTSEFFPLPRTATILNNSRTSHELTQILSGHQSCTDRAQFLIMISRSINDH